MPRLRPGHFICVGSDGCVDPQTWVVEGNLYLSAEDFNNADAAMWPSARLPLERRHDFRRKVKLRWRRSRSRGSRRSDRRYEFSNAWARCIPMDQARRTWRVWTGCRDGRLSVRANRLPSQRVRPAPHYECNC